MLDFREVVPTSRRRAPVVVSPEVLLTVPAICSGCRRIEPPAGTICARCLGELLRMGHISGLTYARTLVMQATAAGYVRRQGARNDLGDTSVACPKLAAGYRLSARQLSRAFYLVEGVEDFPWTCPVPANT